MKPYLYILAVLLAGGGIGYYLGQKSVLVENYLINSNNSKGDDLQLINKILTQQTKAYDLHDELLLLKDCAETYTEIDGNSGSSRGLQKAIIHYHEQFFPEKSITFNLKNPEIKIINNSALIKSSYTKTSTLYEKEGIQGIKGEGIWLLSKLNGSWQINAFSSTEEVVK